MFKRLRQLSTLRYIAFPYAVFVPLNAGKDMLWQPGQRFEFRLRLFGVIPFGIYTINVLEFDMEKGIYTEESNSHVPAWNHRISVEPVSSGSVRYTDEVEISAGRKTPVVYL